MASILPSASRVFHHAFLSIVLLVFSSSIPNLAASDIRGDESSLRKTYENSIYGSFQNTSLTDPKALSCKRTWSSRIKGYVTCCNISAKGTDGTEGAVGGVIKCLPSFIIAGVQKGGTTALSALLCTLDSISFSKKKEVHFFDNQKKYQLGVSEYLRYFHAWNYTGSGSVYPPVDGESTPGIEPPVFGESTPFYIAHRDACQRISETVPDVKIIVLLREPVARAYSEYQMKKRRVDNQDEFSLLLAAHIVILNRCLVEHPRQWSVITECLPDEITSHSHYRRLISSLKALRNRQPNKAKKSNQFDRIFRIHSDSTTRLGRKKGRLLRSRRAAKSEKGNPSNLINPLNATLGDKSGDRRSQRKIHKKKISNRRTVIERDQHHDRLEREEVLTQIQALLGKHAAERLSPLGISLGKELRDWEKCAGPLVGPGMTLESLDVAVEKCLHRRRGIRMGISSMYFYRSLYAVQLYNCFKYIPRERFLILTTEQLQSEPEGTLDLILRFIGILKPSESNVIFETEDSIVLESERGSAAMVVSADGEFQVPLDGRVGVTGEKGIYKGVKKEINWRMNKGSNKDRKKEMNKGGHEDRISVTPSYHRQEFIGAAVDKYFPSFESTSGWRLHSEYEQIPPELRVELDRFFKPYNELLSGLLGAGAFQEQFMSRWYGKDEGKGTLNGSYT